MPSSVRNQVCSGCYRGCVYDDFRDRVPTTPDIRRGHNRRTFGQTAADLHIELKEKIAAGIGGAVRRAGVLGRMHAEKQSEWNRMTAECFHRGEALPRSTEEAILWALQLGARRFREEVLHLPPELVHARRGTPLTLLEFSQWWEGVQPELPLLLPPEGVDPARYAVDDFDLF